MRSASAASSSFADVVSLLRGSTVTNSFLPSLAGRHRAAISPEMSTGPGTADRCPDPFAHSGVGGEQVADELAGTLPQRVGVGSRQAGPIGQQLGPVWSVDTQEAMRQFSAGVFEWTDLRRQAEDRAAALAADDREHAADPGGTPQRRVDVWLPQPLHHHSSSLRKRSCGALGGSRRAGVGRRRLSGTAALTRSRASIAVTPSSVFQALPTSFLAASSSGGSSPAVKTARSSAATASGAPRMLGTRTSSSSACLRVTRTVDPSMPTR